jgi:uncharacterized membrane protein YkvA (DUF1232 family)
MATGEVREQNGGKQQARRGQDDRAAYEAWLARREEANTQSAEVRAREEAAAEAWDRSRKRAAESELEAVRSTRPAPSGWLMRRVEHWAERVGKRHLVRLAQERGNLAQAVGDVPTRMRKVAHQTQLALELLDDFRSGHYRDIPWHSAALLSAAVLYVVSPLDVVPDAIPALGQLDEVAVLTVAVRVAEKDLRRYCQFKKRSEADYF